MSKNTGTSELINYFTLGVNGDVGIGGNLTLSTIVNATVDTDRFLVSDSGVIKYRTGAQLLSDIGGQGALTNPVTGTGTTNVIPKFTGTSTIGDSAISDTTTEVNITKRVFITSGVHQFVFTPNLSSASNRIEAIGGLPLEITTSGSSIGMNVGGGSSQFSMTNTAASFFIPVTSNGQAATSPAFIANNGVGSSGTAQHYINFTAGTTTIARMLRGNGASGLVANGLNIDNFEGFGVRLNQLGGSGGSFNITGGNVGIGTTDPTSTFNARLAVRNEDAANNPTLVLFKNINSASSEDIFRVQSWNGAFNTVASIRANGSASFSSTISAGSHITGTCTTSFNGDGIRVIASATGAGGSQPGIGYWTAAGSKRFINQLDVSSDTWGLVNATGSNLILVSQSGLSTFSSSVAGYGITLNHTSENLRLKMGGLAGGVINIQGEVISSGGAYPIVLNRDGGNVGIGVNPQDRLDVNGSIRFRANTPNFTAVTDNAVLDYVPTSIFATTPTVRLAAIGTASVGAEIRFLTGTSTSLDTRMTIKSSGNVLIGTTSDSGSKLRVNGGNLQIDAGFQTMYTYVMVVNPSSTGTITISSPIGTNMQGSMQVMAGGYGNGLTGNVTGLWMVGGLLFFDNAGTSTITQIVNSVTDFGSMSFQRSGNQYTVTLNNTASFGSHTKSFYVSVIINGA